MKGEYGTGMNMPSSGWQLRRELGRGIRDRLSACWRGFKGRLLRVETCSIRRLRPLYSSLGRLRGRGEVMGLNLDLDLVV